MVIYLTYKRFGIFDEALDPTLRGGNRRLFLGVRDDLLSQLLGSLRGHGKGLVEGGQGCHTRKIDMGKIDRYIRTRHPRRQGFIFNFEQGTISRSTSR